MTHDASATIPRFPSPTSAIDRPVLARAARDRARRAPSRASTRKLAEVGILESLKLPQPPPPLHDPAQQPRLHHAGVLGLRCRQVDRGGELRARPSARRRHRGEDRRHRRRSRARATARRLSQLLVHRPRAREALDQPARQPRALQRRPSARRRHRLLPRHRTAQDSSTSWSATSTTSPRRSAAARAEARLSRPSGDRARAGQALPPDRRPPPPRSRRLFHRRARPPAALFHRGGAGARRRSGELLGRNLRIQPVAHARPRADPDGRARGARHVHGLGDGRPRARARRRRAQARLRGAVARRHHGADVCDRRPRAERDQRGLHRALRPAERDRLCRDLRLGRAHLLGAADAASRSRRRATPT